MKRLILVVTVMAMLVATATVNAGGGLTLKSLDKRLRALTALVLMDERHPAQLEKRVESVSMGIRDSRGISSGTAYCPPGDWKATGGGFDSNNLHAETGVLKSEPDFVQEAWTVTLYTPGPNDLPGTVWVVCTQVES